MALRSGLKYLVLLILVVFPAGCGDDSDEQFIYDVTVINNTSAEITVRYDREDWVAGTVETWVGEMTIQAGDFERVQWFSAEYSIDVIEVLYLGQKKTFYVQQQDTVNVSAVDFQ